MRLGYIPEVTAYSVSSVTTTATAFGLEKTGNGLVRLGTWMQEAAKTVGTVAAQHSVKRKIAWGLFTEEFSEEDVAKLATEKAQKLSTQVQQKEQPAPAPQPEEEPAQPEEEVVVRKPTEVNMDDMASLLGGETV